MGGWDHTITQGTIITAVMVDEIKTKINQFVKEFNQYCTQENVPSIEFTNLTGSSAYYKHDLLVNSNKTYGDIDIQIVAENVVHGSRAEYENFWKSKVAEFVKNKSPSYIHSITDSSHLIFNLGSEQYVQVDIMWHTPECKTWGKFRATQPYGVSGTIGGNLFSVLGNTLMMSIQHSGVQLKLREDEPVSFNSRKNIQLITISTNIETFVYDIFNFVFNHINPSAAPIVDEILSEHKGVNINDHKLENMVYAITGLANSFTLNNMYGKFVLKEYSNKEEFLNKFLEIYELKAINTIESSKYDKAQTPSAIEKAFASRSKVAYGLEIVKGMFKNETQRITN